MTQQAAWLLLPGCSCVMLAARSPSLPSYMPRSALIHMKLLFVVMHMPHGACRLLQECHREMMTHNTITCPLCLKCILPASDAGRYWSFLDQQVRYAIDISISNTYFLYLKMQLTVCL
jgi:hypothetical protein